MAEERAEHFRICSSRLESELVSLQQQLDRSGRENGQRMLEQTGELEKHIHRLDQRNREQNSIIDDLKTQLKVSLQKFIETLCNSIQVAFHILSADVLFLCILL